MAYDFSRLTVFVIDANAFSRQILREMLTAIAISHEAVKELADAESALAELQLFRRT